MKKGLMWIAIAISAIAVLVAVVPAAAWWLYKRSVELEPVGATATFEETVECLNVYGNELVGRDQSVSLTDNKVDVCFPTQTPAKRDALIACFNAYERAHPGHVGWPEDNMRACMWDGLTSPPAPYGLGFGNAVPVPAVPRAGKRFVLRVGVTGSDPDGKEINAAIADGDVDVAVTTDDEPLDFEYGYRADDKIQVSLTVPETAAGKRLQIKLALGADEPSSTKIADFTVRP